LYSRFMMPEGIKAMGEAVELIANHKAPKIVQPTEGATYDAYITAKPELAEIDWSKLGHKAETLHNFIRGCDKIPGAWTMIDSQKVIFYGSTLWDGSIPDGQKVKLDKFDQPAIVHANGLLLSAIDGGCVNVRQLQLADGKMIPASKYGKSDSDEDRVDLELSDDEKMLERQILAIWKGVLNMDHIEKETDFFFIWGRIDGCCKDVGRITS